MRTGDESQAVGTFDRQLLLLGPKRNAVLELWEVQRYGADSYGDPAYVSIYGLPPTGWYEKGIRLLGRTAVECTRDQLADQIGRDTAEVAKTAPPVEGVIVVDPFAGSGNTLYWILRHLPHAKGLGFELDRGVFEMTRRNLSLLGLRLDIRQGDYVAALRALSLPDNELLVAFIAPPWGKALSPRHGLDLRRTTPPLPEIVDLLDELSPARVLLSIQVHERVDPSSLEQLTARFDWSDLRIYDFNRPGQNHGLLLATIGWRP